MDIDTRNSTESTNVAPIFHSRFSFPDGDLVFSASLSRKKDSKTYFRVHKAMLRLHSSTFSDMFDMPPGDSGSAANSEIVHLHDDDAAVVKLLTVIYYPDEISAEPLRQDTFESAAAILPLADKYDMPRMTNMFLPRVKADWPKTLARWDLNESHIKAVIDYFDRLHRERDCYRYGDDVLVEPCSAIRLGRTFPLPEILPAAFYHLSRLPPIFHDDDKSDLYWEHVIEGGRTADWGLLSRDDYQTLLLGKSEIRKWMTRFASFWGEQKWRTISHSTRDDCEGIPWWTQQMQLRLFELAVEDELDVLGIFSKFAKDFSAERENGQATSKLCSSCLYGLTTMFTEWRQTFWNKLPTFFEIGVEDWGEEDDSMGI